MSWAIWVTGLPGSGKSAVARGVARELEARGERLVVLELDALRTILTPAPRYTTDERQLVYRTLVYVAALLVDEGVPVIIDATGHRREWRHLARAMIRAFAEVQLVCDLEVCRARERSRPPGHAPRGIYDAAGHPGATVPGVDVPYEPALAPELVVDTAVTPLDVAIASVAGVVGSLERAAPARRESGGRAAPGPGWALWMTGLPGSGKSTLAEALVNALDREGRAARRLEVEELRQMVLSGARPAPAQEDLLHRALVVTARALTEVNVRVVIDAVATRRAWRELARTHIPHFAEVQLMAPLGLCCDRERAVRWRLTPSTAGGRPKAGRTPNGPNVVLDYEYSLTPDLTLRTDTIDVASATRELLRLAERLERNAERSAARPESSSNNRPPERPIVARTEETTMRVRELMTRGLITVSPETTVTEARTLMANERIRHLLVTDGGRLAGIVTDRDIRLNLASPATTLSVWELNYLLARLTVAEVMTKSLIVVEPDRDAREAARIMLDHKIGALPVLDGDRLVGILTETDLVRAFAESVEPATAAR
ncbi:MAG: adenylyl-sulfate kinase [Candidatus Rokubacteria bacterium]|nr:adenylyl-sulfate kinase [Candidatus Rokubacteria bacterium]